MGGRSAQAGSRGSRSESTMAPMTEKQMPAIAVQPRPREIKVNNGAPLETNNNTRMVSGGNIDYNKLISADNVPGKNISSDFATAPTLVEGKKEAAETKKPQVCYVRACVRPSKRLSIASFTSALSMAPRRNHNRAIQVTIKKKQSVVKY